MINAQSAAPFSPNTGPASPSVAQTTLTPTQPAVNTTTVNVTAPTPPASNKKGMSRTMKLLLGGLLLLIVVVGSGVSYYLNQQSQDVRQQADELKASPSPVIRPPETTAPTASAVCTKSAFIDPGPGQTSNLVQTTSFNSSQGIMFRIAVSKNDDRVIPLSVTDDFSDFVKAGYEFVSAETGSAQACRPDDGFNRDNPGFYKCDWLNPEQGQTLVLYIRLRPTTNYLVEPEKVATTNRASVALCELCGGGALQDGGTAGLAAPTGTSSSCPLTVMIPGNTGATPPAALNCNSACSLVAANGSAVKDPCTTALGNGYACTQVIDRPENEGEPTHRCRLVANPTESSCKAVVANLTCNSSCTPTLSNAAGAPDACAQSLGSSYGCLNVAADTTTANDYRCRLKLSPSNNACQIASSPTATPTTTPTQTPAIGCNQTCNSNSDCSNPDHVCTDVGEGQNVCRLSSNVNSSSCSSVVSQTTEQPTLPEELPQTGADMTTWFKAGLGALGIGIMVLLLL